MERIGITEIPVRGFLSMDGLLLIGMRFRTTAIKEM